MQKKNVQLVDRLQTKLKCKRSSCRTYASTIKRVARDFGKGYNIFEKQPLEILNL